MQYLVHPVIRKSTNQPGSEQNKGRCYAIAALQTAMVVGLETGGPRIEQQNWAASTRQMFRFIPVGDNYVEIEVVDSGMVLGVDEGGLSNTIRIVEQERAGAHHQHWQLKEIDSGQFAIISRRSNKVWDLGDYTDGAGAVIYQYEQHLRANQRWIFSEIVLDQAYDDLSATFYTERGYGGASQTLGVGSYNPEQLSLGNDTIKSARVPDGLQVTVYENSNFNHTADKRPGGYAEPYRADAYNIDAGNGVSSIIIEKLITVYFGAGFSGDYARFPVGPVTAQMLDNTWKVGNDCIRSVRVPEGMLVVAFEHDLFKGEHIILVGDEPHLPDGWDRRISSMIIKQTGVIVPAHSLRYGGKIALRCDGPGRFLVAREDGGLDASNVVNEPGQTFKIMRSGQSTLQSHVCYGDIVTLKSEYGKYVVAEKDGAANANRTAIGSYEKWKIVRAGNSSARSFVCEGDQFALESVAHKKYLTAAGSDDARASSTSIGDRERWTPTAYKPPNQSADGAGPGARTSRTRSVGVSACGGNVCVTEACLADACGAASCSAAATLTSVCGAAASGMVLCGVDVAGVSTGGMAACVAALDGVGACGADACGAAICGAAACGAAACAVAACGADACGAAANLFGACGANAGGITACGADVCGANACGVNMCPADFCGADVCGVDVVPIVPFF